MVTLALQFRTWLLRVGALDENQHTGHRHEPTKHFSGCHQGKNAAPPMCGHGNMPFVLHLDACFVATYSRQPHRENVSRRPLSLPFAELSHQNSLAVQRPNELSLSRLLVLPFSFQFVVTTAKFTK